MKLFIIILLLHVNYYIIIMINNFNITISFIIFRIIATIAKIAIIPNLYICYNPFFFKSKLFFNQSLFSLLSKDLFYFLLLVKNIWQSYLLLYMDHLLHKVLIYLFFLYPFLLKPSKMGFFFKFSVFIT